MRFVAVDVETANPNMSGICQIGLVEFCDGVEVAADSVLIDPQTWFDPMNVAIHGIDEETVSGSLPFPSKTTRSGSTNAHVIALSSAYPFRPHGYVPRLQRAFGC